MWKEEEEKQAKLAKEAKIAQGGGLESDEEMEEDADSAVGGEDGP